MPYIKKLFFWLFIPFLLFILMLLTGRGPGSCNNAGVDECGKNAYVDCFWHASEHRCTDYENMFVNETTYSFSDANGIITDLVMALWDGESRYMANTQALIISNLETARIHLFAMGGENNVNYPILMELLSKYGADNEIILYDATSKIRPWTRDPWIRMITYDGAENDYEHTTLWFNHENKTSKDKEIAETLEKKYSSIIFKPLPLSLELPGGNAIVSDQHILIGDSILRKNPSLSEDQIIDELNQSFKRDDLVIIKDAEALYYHLDIRAQYVGKHRFVVGDISLANEILTEVQNTNPELLLERENAIERMYDITLPADNYLLSVASEAMKYDSEVDNIAVQLTRLGYNVFRVPYLPPLSQVSELLEERTPAFIYTNGLVMVDENLHDGKTFKSRVLMPTFDFEPMDSFAKGVYESLGFDVRKISSVWVSALDGSVHCLTNDIIRDIAPSDDLIRLYSK